MKLTPSHLRRIIKEEVQSAELEQLMHAVANEIAALVLDAADVEDKDDSINDGIHPEVFNILLDLIEQARQFKI